MHTRADHRPPAGFRCAVPLLGAAAVALALTLAGCAQPATDQAQAPTSTLSAGLGSGSATGVTGSAVSSSGAAVPAATPSSGAPASRTGGPSGTGGPGRTEGPTDVPTADGSVVGPLTACRPATLRTLIAGRLTFGAPAQAAAPWFIGPPSAGQGFEAAVAAAVARRLGYPSGAISWTTADPTVIAGGATGRFDVALGEFAIPEGGARSVDYTTGYFANSTSVVALAGRPAAALHQLRQLTGLRIATTTVSGPGNLAARLAPATTSVVAGPAAALAALRSGAVDAALLPTPAALTAGPGFTVVGQLTAPSEQPQQFGMVLHRASPLTSCVSAAIDELRVTGVLAALVDRWTPAADRPLP